MKWKTPSRSATTLTVVMAALAASTIFAQKLADAKTEQETTCQLVCKMISQYHISQGKISDETSARLVKAYVAQLDPQKLYFTQSDIDEFRKFDSKLDDQLGEGDVSFAYETFERFLKRLDRQIVRAQALIDAEHDFTIDEEIVLDPEELSWARSEEELRERWRKRIKYDLLSLKLEDVPVEEARERLHKRYKNIRLEKHQMEDFEKLELYLSSLTHTFDPHSSYMSPQTLEDFRISMELKLQGIGASLRSRDGYITVEEIVPGGAADKDGRLKPGDKIVGVAQDDGEFVDVVEMKITKVVRLIRGEKGTKVRLRVQTATGDVQVYELTRQVIELKASAVRGEVINLDERFSGEGKGSELRVGVISIPSFYRDFEGARTGLRDFKSASRDVRKVLREFREKGVDAVVVDLRFNGGGALTEAIEVSGLFIDRGPVVQIKEPDGGIKAYEDDDSGVEYSGPLVVLVNRLSASASEIFAGVIKDYKRGVVVGDKTTHGKGTVQNVMPVGEDLLRFLDKNRGALKLTINQFYRVNGHSTQNHGVRSDVVLPSLYDHVDEIGESNLDNALPFDKIRAAEFSPMEMVSSEVLDALQKSSERRVAAEPKFKETLKEIDKYLARKNRKTASLNEAELRREREEEQVAEKKKKEELEDTAPPAEDGDGPLFPDSHYNDEVLRIAVDYASLLKELRTAKN